MPHTPPEEAALRWVPGGGPVELRPLCEGTVNHSWQVGRAGRLYSLRLCRTDGEDLGLDRTWECRVLGQVSAAGLAPGIVHCDPVQGILVAEWVAGRPWTGEEARMPPNIRAMAQLLRRVHALPVPQPARSMSPASWVTHYGAACRRSGLPAARRSSGLGAAAAARLDRLAALPRTASALCHGDLHRHNLVVADRLRLLDWEYAHVADPFWDLAGWISNNDWPAAAAADLLAGYLGRTAAAAEAERLRLLAWLYDYVCLVWGELCIYRRPGSDAPIGSGEDALRARGELLAARMTGVSGGRAGQDPAH